MVTTCKGSAKRSRGMHLSLHSELLTQLLNLGQSSQVLLKLVHLWHHAGPTADTSGAWGRLDLRQAADADGSLPQELVSHTRKVWDS